MHITHHGNDVKNIKYNVNKFNTTISFWVFEDRVVYQEETGLGEW